MERRLYEAAQFKRVVGNICWWLIWIIIIFFCTIKRKILTAHFTFQTTGSFSSVFGSNRSGNKNSNSKPTDDGKNRGIHPIICKLTIKPTPPVNLRPCCPKPCNAPGWDTSVPAPRSCWLAGQAVFDWSTNMPINRQLDGTGMKVNLLRLQVL